MTTTAAAPTHHANPRDTHASAGDLDALLADLDLSDNERRYLECYRYRLKRIITDLPDLNGKDVLDVGCNTGFMMALFRRLWPDVRPVGCDICRGYVTAARQRGFPALVCNLEASEVPFAAESFDVVFAGEFIEMLASLDPLFKGILRVLRPGGRLFAQTMNLGCLSNRVNLALNRPIFLKWSRQHDFNFWRRSYLRSELTDMLTHYGLIDIKIDEVPWWRPDPLRRLVGRALAAANCSLGAMFTIEARKPG
jgi:SAM-dependent methyltransferase